MVVLVNVLVVAPPDVLPDVLKVAEFVSVLLTMFYELPFARILFAHNLWGCSIHVEHYIERVSRSKENCPRIKLRAIK